MKGLLLKDWYMMKSYCKMYIAMTAIFLVAGNMPGADMFFLLYPCIIVGMIPVTLMGYEERSKWCDYCRTMPYSKGQIVSSKYIISLALLLAVLLLCTAAMTVRLKVLESDRWGELLVLVQALIIVSFFASSITLPWMFKLGVEKGRIAYYVMIGICAGGSVLTANIIETDINSTMAANSLLPVLCLGAAALFALSWYISIVFYKKREC